MSAYCTESDLYDFGLPRGNLPNPGRLVSSIDVTANTLLLDVHGYATDEVVTFRAEAGGALPSPLTAGTSFFVIKVTQNAFSVAATQSGSAIDLTTSSDTTLVISDLPFAAAITWASGLIEGMLPSHIVPLVEPFNPLVVATCAELATGKLLTRTGSASESLGEMVKQAQMVLQRWAKNIPLRGENVPPPANKAVSATVPRVDARGWTQFGGL